MPRPRFTPTPEQRRLVKSLAAYGTPQELIARRLGIRSPKTLRKHFRQELDDGILEANAKVAQTMYEMATSGEHPTATMFWLRTRNGWRDSYSVEARSITPPPFIVAKEEGGAQA